LPFGKLLNQHTNINSESSVTALRLIHYPPILFEVPENCIRCAEHTDYGTMTYSSSRITSGGLGGKNRNNEWVQAHPVPGALLVNVGDMLQNLTSGRLRATVSYFTFVFILP
ncbi:putative 2-oxoglutarate-dependent dioxygenase, partial [Armadillidium vulgare]